MTADLITDFPILGNLTQDELNKALATGGLGQALMRARIRKAVSPRKPGRPATAKLSKKVIQRRGRKAEKKISPIASNVQLAKLALVMQSVIGGSVVNAVRLTLNECRYEHTDADVRKISKVAAEMPALEQDKAVRAKQVKQHNEAQGSDFDSSIFGQLRRASHK